MGLGTGRMNWKHMGGYRDELPEWVTEMNRKLVCGTQVSGNAAEWAYRVYIQMIRVDISGLVGVPE